MRIDQMKGYRFCLIGTVLGFSLIVVRYLSGTMPTYFSSAMKISWNSSTSFLTCSLYPDWSR